MRPNGEVRATSVSPRPDFPQRFQVPVVLVALAEPEYVSVSYEVLPFSFTRLLLLYGAAALLLLLIAALYRFLR